MEYKLRWDTYQEWTKESAKEMYQDSDYNDLTSTTDEYIFFFCKLSRFRIYLLYLKFEIVSELPVDIILIV